MANFVQGYELRTLLYGNQVIKAAQTPPNSGSSATLFTVAAAGATGSGAVLITSLLGRVSTALSGTTGTIAIGQTPTASGTADTGGIATAGVVGGAVVGTWLSVVPLTTGLAGAVQANILSGATVSIGHPFVVSAGVITITTAVATMTGAIDWYLTYIPLDTGASVS